MHSEKDLFLATEPLHLFFKAAIPGAIGMIASNIYFSVEMLLIGRLIGQTAFAAGNLALPFILIAYALADMIAVGSSICIAIKLGEGRRDDANRIFTAAVFIAAALSAVSGALIVVFSRSIFSMMGADPVLMHDAVEYITVYALFIPFTALAFVFDNYLRICGRVRFSMAMNIAMAAMCLAFEILFLYVLDKGIGYAALGTSLGMSITCIICIIPFLKGKMTLRFVKLRITKEILHDIFRQGLPAFLSNTSGRLTSIIMNSMLLHLGGPAAVSVYGVFMNIDGIIVPGMYGVFDSLQPAIGYNWGAGRKDRVRRIALYGTIAIAFMCIAFTILLELFPVQIFAMFIEDADAYSSMAMHAIRIIGLMYIVRWTSYACQSFSSAIGYSRECLMISLCNAFVFPLLMMYILKGKGLDGMWLSLPSAALLTALLAVFIYIARLRKAVTK